MSTDVPCGAAGSAALVSTAAIWRVDGWLRAVEARAARIEDPRVGYVVVTPLGMPERGWLGAALAGAGVALLGRSPVPSWSAVSTALYVRRTGPALARAVRFERAWEALFPQGAAEAWAVDPASVALLAAVKHAIRAELPHVRITLGPSERAAVLHPFHVADAGDRADEARRLLAALSLLSGAPPRAVVAPALAG